MLNLNSYQYQKLAADIRSLSNSTKTRFEDAAGNELVNTYWQIGRRIEKEKLVNNSKEYSSALQKLSKEVNIDPTILRRAATFFRTYPRGFGKKDELLSWSHYKSLITIKDEALRNDLEEKAKKEKWGRNKLIEAIRVSSQDNVESLGSKIKRPRDAQYIYKARIVNVIDGDTLMLDIDLGFQVIKRQRIRLAGINAAEMKTEVGKKAAENLSRIVNELDEVVVRTNKIDIYGRYVGDIFYPKTQPKKSLDKIEVFENGTYLNEELVVTKFAKIF